MKYLDIVVLLGKKCNLNCIYCVQHKDSITNIDYGDNTDYVIDFINSICNNHDFYISVGFYGGEPLLYFQKMKKITEKTTANEYRVISNGKELNNQIINFFNKHNIVVTLSWDGEKSKENRGFDVIQEKWNFVKKINHLMINSVITNNVCIKNNLFALDILAEEYKKIHGYYFEAQMSPVVIRGTSPKIKYDSKVFYDDLSQIMNAIDIHADKHPISVAYILSYADKINFKLHHGSVRNDCISCTNGTSISIDLHGNVYSCMNSIQKISTIDKNINNIIDDVKKYNYISQRDTKCKNCIYEGITCKNSSCAILNDDEYELNCNSCKHYGEVLFNVLMSWKKSKE